MTHKQRLSFYKELLKVVCDDPHTGYGFCYYITREMKSWYIKNKVYPICAYDDDKFKKHLPELYKMKPEKTYYNNPAYWFAPTPKGWQQRIDLLQQVIDNMSKTK
jgi:hypothetical protein